jgi:hypothetical protein
MDSVLIAAEAMEKLDSLDGGRAMLVVSHMIVGKVCRRPGFGLVIVVLSRKSRRNDVQYHVEPSFSIENSGRRFQVS